MSIRISTLVFAGLLSALPIIATAACPGQVNALYTQYSNGTITDKQTSLMWQQCSAGTTTALCSGSASSYTWQQALLAVQTANSNTLAGYRDWRLPSVAELNTLVDSACSAPSINSSVFPATLAEVYWTASTYTADASKAWGVNFADGSANAISKSASHALRLVRDAAK